MYKYFMIKETMHVVDCECQQFANEAVMVKDNRDLTINKKRSADSTWSILRLNNIATPMKHVYLEERNDDIGRQLLKQYYQNKLSVEASKKDKLSIIIDNLS